MKTKRRLLAFFFSLLLICQGCFSAQAEEKNREQESNHPITFTKELVNGGIQEVKDTEGSSHYLLEYLVRFDGKNFEGTHQENGYENVIFQDTLENEMLRFFNPAYRYPNSEFENQEQYIPRIRRGVWRSGEYREDGSGKKIF